MPCHKTTATAAGGCGSSEQAVGGAAVLAGIAWMHLLQGFSSWDGVRTPHPLSTHCSAAREELNGCLAAGTSEAGELLFKTAAAAGLDVC